MAKLRENRLIRLGHVKRRTIDTTVRMVKNLILQGKRSQGRPNERGKNK